MYWESHESCLIHTCQWDGIWTTLHRKPGKPKSSFTRRNPGKSADRSICLSVCSMPSVSKPPAKEANSSLPREGAEHTTQRGILSPKLLPRNHSEVVDPNAIARNVDILSWMAAKAATWKLPVPSCPRKWMARWSLWRRPVIEKRSSSTITSQRDSRIKHLLLVFHRKSTFMMIFLNKQRLIWPSFQNQIKNLDFFLAAYSDAVKSQAYTVWLFHSDFFWSKHCQSSEGSTTDTWWRIHSQKMGFEIYSHTQYRQDRSESQLTVLWCRSGRWAGQHHLAQTAAGRYG